MSKFDTDILNEVLSQSGSGKLGDMIARSIQTQVKREAFVKSHRTLLKVSAVGFIIAALAVIGVYGLFVVGVILALLTVIPWQTAGIFLGVALITFILQLAVLKPLAKRVEPYYDTMGKLNKQEKAAKAQG
jgi:hypothetical protein